LPNRANESVAEQRPLEKLECLFVRVVSNFSHNEDFRIVLFLSTNAAKPWFRGIHKQKSFIFSMAF
jgi:hypothetical protein